MPVSLDKATDYLCLADIARELGVSRATVTNWHQRHADFPHIETLGGMSYVKRGELYAWLDATNRWESIRKARESHSAEVRKPRVRRDVAEIRRLIERHESDLKRLTRELARALDSQ
ncbi:helix-turn-helix domain-containing protein [Streptomyces finlayi]|nr:helix-turn-helix domain-containing protein [Streptomyces finlayi]